LYPGQSNGDEEAEAEAEAEAEDRNRGAEEAMAARVAAMAWLNARERICTQSARWVKWGSFKQTFLVCAPCTLLLSM